MLDVNQRADISARLEKLSSTQKGIFGIMTPQHMVEHLIYALRFSNGKLPQKLMFREEKAAMLKEYMINTDKEMVVGFKAPVLGDDLLPLQYPDLLSAIEVLKSELDDFDSYYQENPEAFQMNPSLGMLNHGEWIIFHNKHFNHHFKQFELLD